MGTRLFGFIYTLLCFLRCGPTRFHSLYLATVTNKLYMEWHSETTFLRPFKSYYWAYILYRQPESKSLLAYTFCSRRSCALQIDLQ
jgi:hypothetical protein